MNIIVDYGNSSAKVGIFERDVLKHKHVFEERTALKDFLKNYSADNFIISSVKVDASEVLSWANATQKFILNVSLPLPINNLYATPQTLGVDRLAAVCGANQQYPNSNVLVVDAGTCVKYDFVDSDANYHGGAISPGLSMRFKAMHTLTARLPLVNPIDNPPLIGNSTETCMQSGAINGLVAEIDGLIELYEKKYSRLQVILCGGDTHFFETKLKASIFASPELVLFGLNSILIHNVNLQNVNP